MSLTSGKSILREAEKCGYAVGGFDVFNMESLQAIVAAAEETGMSVFLQACILSLQHTGLGYAIALLKEAARQAKIPVCLHVDHGPEVSDIDQLREFMRAGFNSIMVDGSKLSFEDNVALTRKVVRMAHAWDIDVEGELGHVSRNINATQEELQCLMTDPDQAASFVEKTGLDYLAVSVGSVSGFYQGQINLDMERLAQIKKKVPVPLVFHGGTSIPERQLKQAIKCGVKKINVAHGVRKAFWGGVLKGMNEYDKTKTIDPRIILSRGRSALTSYVKEKIIQMRETNDKLS